MSGAFYHLSCDGYDDKGDDYGAHCDCRCWWPNGRQLIKATTLVDSATLGVAVERTGSTLVGVDAGELAGGAYLIFK